MEKEASKRSRTGKTEYIQTNANATVEDDEVIILEGEADEV